MSVAALGKVVAIGLDSAADVSEEVLARDSDAAPSVLWPGSQAEHSVGPLLDQKLAAEYLPASQAEQLLAPLPEYRPSAQALHSRHPVPRKLHSPARK